MASVRDISASTPPPEAQPAPAPSPVSAADAPAQAATPPQREMPKAPVTFSDWASI